MILLLFSPECKLISAVLNSVNPGCFDECHEIKNLTAVTQLSNLSLEVFSRQLGMGMVKNEDKMSILDPNYIFCAPNVVNFSI